MKPVRTLVVSVLFVLIAVAVGAWLYPQLPDRMPTHWNVRGEVDGWSPRFWGVAMWPMLIAVLAALTLLLPAISPRRFGIKPFAGTFGVLMLAIQAFLLVLGLCVMLAGAGYAVPIPLVATLAVGVLWMVLGNSMGKLRKNFFIGIRTPWTLASDAVWERTHRLGGWVFMAGGLAAVVIALAHLSVAALVAVIACAVVIPVVYSYFAYRRLEAHPRSQRGGA